MGQGEIEDCWKVFGAGGPKSRERREKGKKEGTGQRTQ